MNKLFTICGMVAIVAMTTGCSSTPAKVECNNDYWFNEFCAMTDSCLYCADSSMWVCYSDDLVGCMHTGLITNQGQEIEVIQTMFGYPPFRDLVFDDWDGYCGWSFLAGMPESYYYNVLDIFNATRQEWFEVLHPDFP